MRKRQTPGDEHDARGLVGGDKVDALAQFDPVQVGHHHVAEDDVEGLALRDHGQRVEGVRGHDDLELGRKDEPQRLGDDDFVFDEENARGAGAGAGRRPDGLGGRRHGASGLSRRRAGLIPTRECPPNASRHQGWAVGSWRGRSRPAEAAPYPGPPSSRRGSRCRPSWLFDCEHAHRSRSFRAGDVREQPAVHGAELRVQSRHHAIEAA